MSARAAALAGQSAALQLMTDTCTITRAAGERTFDPVTGAYSQPTTTVYSGRCRIREATTAERAVEAGEEEISTWRWLVSVPLSVAPELLDLVTITASDDDTLVGRSMRLRQVTRGTHITARRMQCEETEAP